MAEVWALSRGGLRMSEDIRFITSNSEEAFSTLSRAMSTLRASRGTSSAAADFLLLEQKGGSCLAVALLTC